MHPVPIFSKYLEIFDDACATELARAPDIDKDKITAYIENVQRTTKIHTFFMNDNIKNVVVEIMKSTAIRDFVFCTTDRFLITMAGNEHITYINLAHIIAAIGSDENSGPYRLIESLIPKAVADGISPPVAEIVGILRDNKFLIVPLMVTLNVAIPETDTTPAKPKKS